MLQQAFAPSGATANIANVTNATANVQFNSSGAGNNTPYQVRVYNAGTQVAFVAFGSTSAVTAATATSMPVPPGAVEVFTVPFNTQYIAAISANANSGALYATPGEGV